MLLLLLLPPIQIFLGTLLGLPCATEGESFFVSLLGLRAVAQPALLVPFLGAPLARHLSLLIRVTSMHASITCA